MSKFKSELKEGTKGEEVQYLNNFLRDYFDGVIDLDNYHYESKDIFDEETVQKLKLFQKHHQLKESGILDNDTANLINNTTCITMPPFVIDNGDEDAAAPNPSFNKTPNRSKFALVSNPSSRDKDKDGKWKNNTYFDKTNLTYGFRNFAKVIYWIKNDQIVKLNDGDRIKTQRVAMEKYVANQIYQKTQGKFTLIEDKGNPESADITIEFNTHEYFAKNLQILGQTLPPQRDAQVKKGRVILNGYRHYTTHGDLLFSKVTENKSLYYINIIALLLHETLHAMGLAHTYTYKNAVMWPSYEEYDGRHKIDLYGDDIAGLNKVYTIISNV